MQGGNVLEIDKKNLDSTTKAALSRIHFEVEKPHRSAVNGTFSEAKQAKSHLLGRKKVINGL
jgi:hypothetical protein